MTKKKKEEKKDAEQEMKELAAAEAFRMDSAILSLVFREHFFATLARRISKRENNRMPTAGVTVRDGEMIMEYNRRFMGNLTGPHTHGVLIHEFYHLILNHVTGRRRSPPLIWNFATDMAINSMIDRKMLPDLCLFPGERPNGPDGKPVTTPVADLIAGLPPKMSADWYFTKLMTEWPPEPECPIHGPSASKSPGVKGKNDQKGDDGGGGEGDEKKDGEGKQGGCGHEHGEGDPCDCGDGCGGQQCGHDGSKGNGGFDDPRCTCGGGISTFDDHGGWDMSEADRVLGEAKIRKELEDAIREADKNNSWGNIPAEMRDHLRELISQKVDWRAVLRAFIGFSQRANRSNSIKRINRRYPYIHPGQRRGYTANIFIAIDQSGSVGNEAIELFFAELSNLARRATFTVGFFDTEMDKESIFVWRKGQRVQPKRHRCGGTDFNAPTRFVNSEKKGTYEGLLIMTDGECCEPDATQVRRGWIICPGREMMFKTHEMVIEMDKQKDE